MQWNLKWLLVASALVALWTPMVQSQEVESSQTYTQILRWKNGDALPGKLLESTSGMIHWASPYFLDDLVVNISVLDSVVFPKQSAPATEAFRVGTVSGDIWIADIVDSDNDSFLFSSKRHGRFRVNRSAIYTLERRVHPNLIYDGSQLTSWKLPKRGTNNRVLQFGRNAQSDWYADRGGHLRTDKVKAKIFHALDWPQRFEIDLELASTTRPPGFVFALGKNLYEALRLETWVNELVVVQGTLFEPVLTIQPERRDFRLRLVYDGDADVLEVFDSGGNLLLKLDAVGPTVEESGVYIYNRGQNLTVRRLRVYEQPISAIKEKIDPSKARVHMMDGQVIYGRLFVNGKSTYVLDEDGNRQGIDVQQIDRVVQPGAALVGTEHPVALTYPDGAVLRGKIAKVNPDSVLLQTAFADEPIACMFTGATVLRVEPNGSKNHGKENDEDRLFHPSGNLRGRVLFSGEDRSFIRWQPVGMSEAVRLTDTRTARIERNNRRASEMWPFDTSGFRHVLHLRSGEIIPCQILSYNETAVGFQSPFINTQRIDSGHVKALEFSGRTHANYIDQTRSINGNTPLFFEAGNNGNVVIIEEIRWHGEVPAGGFVALDPNAVKLENGKIKLMINGKEIEMRPDQDLDELFNPSAPIHHKLDPKLERALTVPRFSRDTPPNHILVAENGDMKRGKLLGFNGETVQFDSKLRQFSVPIDRVARVVDVSKEAVSNQQSTTREETDGNQQTAINTELSVRLTDGSILAFEPIEVKDGQLSGRSSIYGEVVIPVDSIQQLYFGDTTASFKAAFEAWVVRPAKEPDFGDSP